MKKRKLLRSCLVSVMALCMIVSILPLTALASTGTDYDLNGDGVINYVCLGASYTCGYGLDGYMPTSVREDPTTKSQMNIFGYGRAPRGSYPLLVQKALHDQTGNEVKLHQLAMSSMRVEELRVMLDESYDGDAYTRWRFTEDHEENGVMVKGWCNQAKSDGVAAMRKEYQEALQGAEVITVDIGVNDFGIFVMEAMHDTFGSVDWAKEKIPNGKNANGELQYANQQKNVTSNSFDFLASLAKAFGVDRVEKLKSVLTYAVSSFCVNFEAVMQKIYEENPNAVVVVEKIQNPLAEMKLENPLSLFNKTIDFGDKYGEVISKANDWIANGSAYSKRYTYVDPGDISMFSDEIAGYNGDPGTLSQNMKDCFDIYDETYIYDESYGINDYMLRLSSKYSGEELTAAYDAAAKMMKAFNSATTIKVDALTDAMKSGDLTSCEEIYMDFVRCAVDYAAKHKAADPNYSFSLDQDKITFYGGKCMTCNEFMSNALYSATAMFRTRVAMGNCFYEHPSAVGQQELAFSLIQGLKLAS